MWLARREALAIAGAVLLHAAGICVLGATRSETPPLHVTLAPPAGNELEFGIDLDTSGTVVSRNAPEPSPREKGDRRLAGLVRDTSRDAPERTAEELESDDAPAPIPVESDAPSGPVEPGSPIDLGIGPDGWKRWVTMQKADAQQPQAPPKARANRFQVYRAPPASTTGGLLEGLEERDRALGLGPAGRVLSALHRAAHETFAPELGTARFDVTVLRTGVVEVTLGSASDRVEDWKKVAVRIADDLRAAPPRIPPPRRGVRLSVELVAEETMPNGTKVSSLRGPHIEVSPPKLHATDRSVEQMKRENATAQNDAESRAVPPIKLDLPGVYLAERGKVCSYRLGLSPLGPILQGGCDPSHVGAKPQRMVRTRVLEEARF